jgi:hypothetical protein
MNIFQHILSCLRIQYVPWTRVACSSNSDSWFLIIIIWDSYYGINTSLRMAVVLEALLHRMPTSTRNAQSIFHLQFIIYFKRDSQCQPSASKLASHILTIFLNTWQSSWLGMLAISVQMVSFNTCYVNISYMLYILMSPTINNCINSNLKI